MKYISKYKIFESVERLDMESIKTDIDDIFVYAKDLGFKTSINIMEYDRNKLEFSYKIDFRLVFTKKQDFELSDSIDFNIDLVKEDILRMIDYIKQISTSTNISFSLFTMPARWKDIEEFIEDTSEGVELYVFRLDTWVHLINKKG